MEKKSKIIRPITISKDIWFYPLPKSFDFVVWTEINGQRKATQFRLLHSKVKKYL